MISFMNMQMIQEMFLVVNKLKVESLNLSYPISFEIGLDLA
jgi:hypothetical protein